MKKQILLLAMMLLPMVVGAENVEIDGIYYELVSKAKQAIVKPKSSGYYSGNVVIPTTVTYKGEEYSVTSIGYNAFYNCSGLTSIAIPNSVTSIEDNAFRWCSSLTTVSIPNSVTNIGEKSFEKCSGLTSVHISDLAAWCKISFSDFYSNPLYYAHHLYLGEEEIKDLVIPNSVTSIGNYAFHYCSSLTSVTIPISVTSIGEGAFSGCSSLTSVTIPNSVTIIGGSALSGCSRLTSVMIGNSVRSIGNSAFSGCSSLTSVTIGNSLKSVGYSAFQGCSSLTAVHIFDIAAWCIIKFYNSSSNPLVFAHNFYLGEEEIKDLVIPNSVTSIGNWAFYCCSGLISVTIPNSVTSIGEHTFSYCKGLTSVTIGNGIKSIGSQAFASCMELTDVYCLAEEVPTMKDSNGKNVTDAFQDSYIEYATLHVPTASVDAYREKEPWKSFGNIVSLTGEDIPDEPEVKKCATPTIAFVNGELVFNCETEGVEYVSEVTSAETKKYYESKVKIGGTYKVTVYATKTGWDNSDVTTMEFTLGTGGEVCDVNKDGAVDVADIATIISKMAAQARVK